MTPLTISSYISSHRAVSFAAVSVAAVVMLAGITLYQISHAELQFSSPRVAYASAGTVNLSGNSAAIGATSSASAARMVMGLNIANDGLVLLHGAKVVSASGTNILVALSFPSGSFDWQVQTNINTQFFTSDGQKGTLENIKPGDTVIVTGMLSGGGGQPAIQAQFVRLE